MDVLTIKLILVGISISFLGLLGMWWNNEDKTNKITKFIVLSLFIFGTYGIIQSVKIGEVSGMTVFLTILSGILSLLFMFGKVKGNHWTFTLFKFWCIINITSIVILISI